MSTLLLDVRQAEGLQEGICRAVEVLHAGGLVCFPTETVYGVGANALDAGAVRRIFEAKGRPATNPVIVHIADRNQAQSLVTAWPAIADRLAERFWPGPLTLVLPRRAEVPDVVTAGGPTVALRVPTHPVARALIEQANLPIAAPSANRSMRLSPTLAEHVLRDLNGRVELILDGGPTSGGIESTVLDLSGAPRLLRPGLIDAAALEAVIGPLERAIAGGKDDVALPSPGMLSRHYAPQTPLMLTDDEGTLVRDLVARGLRVALVSHHAVKETDLPNGVVLARMPSMPAAYAATLYATLHALDDGRFERIVVTMPPEGEEWLAIRDRLGRASAK
jgi:L-threonylcarbamoyladenylate synthase